MNHYAPSLVYADGCWCWRFVVWCGVGVGVEESIDEHCRGEEGGRAQAGRVGAAAM
jgi:hypothetical protein